MSWEQRLRASTTTVEQLERLQALSARERKQLQHITSLHPMRIPRYYSGLINWSDPEDPLKRMAVPHLDELDLSGSYDTSGESLSTKLPGLQHKYAQTALILATNRCAMYCRHCFRKRLVGLPTEEVLRRFRDAIAYIKQHKEISNVLVSGGDPLVLPTEVVGSFLEKLSQVAHINFVRIGTRVPAVFPDRIHGDSDLIRLFRTYARKLKRLIVVTQFNHPNEITNRSADAIDLLIRAGVVVLNQAILLRGVNDDPVTLAELQSGLVGIGIGPYYIFQCRPVKRVKRHFQVPLREGYGIIEGAKARLDGPSKRFRYVMSHRTGKIEIVAVKGDSIYLKYHQARDPARLGRFFTRKITSDAGWLDDLPRPAAADGPGILPMAPRSAA